jgi:hypothetical protein
MSRERLTKKNADAPTFATSFGAAAASSYGSAGRSTPYVSWLST